MGMVRKKTKQVKKRGSKLSELAGNETQNLGTAHHSMPPPSLTHSAPGPLYMLCQGGGWAYLQHPSGPLPTDRPLPSSSLFCFFFLCLCPTSLSIILQSGCYHPFLASLQQKGKHSLMVQMVRNLPVMQETQVQSLGREDPLAVHCSILAWRIPRTEEPGMLQSIASQRVRHASVTSTFTFTFYCGLAVQPIGQSVQTYCTYWIVQ